MRDTQSPRALATLELARGQTRQQFHIVGLADRLSQTSKPDGTPGDPVVGARDEET
jgi:hypothetical protein